MTNNKIGKSNFVDYWRWRLSSEVTTFYNFERERESVCFRDYPDKETDRHTFILSLIEKSSRPQKTFFTPFSHFYRKTDKHENGH